MEEGKNNRNVALVKINEYNRDMMVVEVKEYDRNVTLEVAERQEVDENVEKGSNLIVG